MARYRRESKLDGNQVPKPLEIKAKALNDDWSRIASLTAKLFAAGVTPRKPVEEIVVEEKQRSVPAGIPLIMEDWREGNDKCSQLFVFSFYFTQFCTRILFATGFLQRTKWI